MTETELGGWLALKNITSMPEEKGRAVVDIPPDSPWFSGHFPGYPVLPGIAQLSVVLETLRGVFSERMQVTGLKRVRFKQPVRPGYRLEVTVSAAKTDGTWTFTIKNKNDVVCSGIMKTERTAGDETKK